ncbi:FGGY-family carbohydrate kinase [uncultured Sphaerochaeta sp.]|uniref:FGGY-family carbohydrate kinase n=1 Tax=uncultured Sphaerochaeta sp. TaxID=886478 RepID=UPI002A0A2670|nr:FGGY-family carbohydrate kinase [uncultured Sphaerochaeta sp.]
MIAVIDVGTTNVRAIVFDDAGRMVFVRKCNSVLSYREQGFVEMEMEAFEASLVTLLSSVGQFLQESGYEVTSLSVTSQRSSVIPVDENGKALHAAIMWQDTRSEQDCERVREWEHEIHSICGMRPSPVFSAPKIAFLKRTEPTLYDKSHKILGFCEYVLFFLTHRFATDTSIASRTCLFDVSNLVWSERLLDLFGLEKEKLCPLVPVGSVVGETTESVSSLLKLKKPVPVVSAGGDQQCAALGLGCIDEHSVMANCGTGSFLATLSPFPILDDRMRINCNVSSIPGLWFIEGSVLSTGKTLDWVNDTFFKATDEMHPYEHFTEASLASPPGSRGLRFSVHLAGKGTPVWDAKVKGAIFNLSLGTKKEDLARGVLEGIACSLAEGLDCLVAVTGTSYPEVKLSGGLSKDELFSQIQADVFGLKVSSSLGFEATALGAWMSAAFTLGMYDSMAAAYEAVKKTYAVKHFLPREEFVSLYEEVCFQILEYENT